MFGINYKTFFFIMFAINLTGLFLIIVLSGVTLALNFNSQNLNTFTHNSGLLFVKSQGVITDAINEVNTNPDISYSNLVANQRFLTGGTAFTVLLIMIVFYFPNKILRRTKRSSWYTLGLIVMSIFIVMILQIIIGYLVLGEFLWPYNGWWSMITNPDAVIKIFTTPTPGLITNITAVVT